MERGVVIVEDEGEDGSEEGMWMPGGRFGDVFRADALAFVNDESVGGGKRIQYFRPERTAFQALNSRHSSWLSSVACW